MENFEIIVMLGTHGFGTVHNAHIVSTVKRNPVIEELASLPSHPNMVQAFDFFYHQEKLVVIIEFRGQQILSNIIHDDNELPPEARSK